VATIDARMVDESPAADLWTDPQADLAKAMIEDAWKRIRRSKPEQAGGRRFALPKCELEVSYAGRTAADTLCAAFAHLEDAANGELPLRLKWRIADAALTEGLQPLPPPPRPLHPFGNLYRNSSNSVLIERRRGFVTAFDVQALQLTTIVDGSSSIDTDLAAKPLLRFLLPLLLKKDIVLCHAALVGGTESGILIAGKGGSGKSTIAAGALTGGAGFCSDDFVALERREDGLVGHCLYSTIMLTAEQIARFPKLAAHAVRLRRDTFPKHLVTLAGPYRGQLRRSLRIDGAAVPEISAQPRSELVTGSRAAVLRAIAPISAFSSPWREAERIRFLFDHVGPLSPLLYRSGSDFGAIAEPLRGRYGF
jgi:hypothetical protein